MAKILFVEDDRAVSDSVVDALRAQRHVVDPVYTATDAREFLLTYSYELIILDWQLPDGSGLEICQNFRREGGQTPVLMLTGKDKVVDKTSGLDSGADDYLTKPFVTDELVARIRALLRRHTKDNVEKLSFADIILDQSARCVMVVSQELSLRPREFALLEFLVANPNKLLPHEQLRNRVWWDEPTVERNTINALVARVRTKLQDSGSKVSIVSVPGEGYRLENNA